MCTVHKLGYHGDVFLSYVSKLWGKLIKSSAENLKIQTFFVYYIDILFLTLTLTYRRIVTHHSTRSGSPLSLQKEIDNVFPELLHYHGCAIFGAFSA